MNKLYYKSNKIIIVYDIKELNYFLFHLSENYVPHKKHDLNLLYKLLNTTEKECFKKYKANSYDFYLGFKMRQRDQTI